MSGGQPIEINFPTLYHVADNASRRAQRYHFGGMGADLLLILLASILGSIAFATSSGKIAFAWGSAILAAGGLIITILLRTKTFEQDWFDGRVIAESVKTRSWRFITKSEPYETAGLQTEEKFIDDIGIVGNERKEFLGKIGSELTNQIIITEPMKSVRLLSFSGRKKLYLEDRIANQGKWYSLNSGKNKRIGNLWFAAILVSQGLLLICCFAMIQWPEMPVNLIGMFSALSAALVAWNQMKRYQDLSHSYGLAASELMLIAAHGINISDESQFSQFVLDSENAISREHSLWKARRDKV